MLIDERTNHAKCSVRVSPAPQARVEPPEGRGGAHRLTGQRPVRRFGEVKNGTKIDRVRRSHWPQGASFARSGATDFIMHFTNAQLSNKMLPRQL